MAEMVSMPHHDSGGYCQLGRFRGEAYDCFTAWSDALFELVDGLSQPVAVDGVAHLSLAASARRGHGSGHSVSSRRGEECDAAAFARGNAAQRRRYPRSAVADGHRGSG